MEGKRITERNISRISTGSVVWLIQRLSALLAGKVACALSAPTIVTHIHSGIGGPAGPAFFPIYSAYSGTTC